MPAKVSWRAEERVDAIRLDWAYYNPLSLVLKQKEKDIELVPLQHPDDKTALEKGNVDVRAGLDPYTAQLEVEKGCLLFFRNKEWNS